ncbi:Transmembrane and coiled-coil domains protein 1 [Armadillidium nasatum]|uniref:Transmembrane and coiled-coil domains protein 1 n=1 Tax=Armadillidium nasatum TaxID=96803 RepID=A0A5N5T2H1_9CRUS|nr:Transmembrane and coiled-coil domains protein 1 [Armadillidium nasatum]
MLSSKAPLLFCRKKGFIGKPKEIAYLIKNKFGSADNIKELGEEEKDEERNHHGSATLPPNSGLHPTSSSIALASKTPAGGSVGGGGSGGAGGGGGSSGGGKIGSEDGSECNSSITSESISGGVTVPLTSFTSPPNHHVMSSFEVPIGNPSIELIMQELKERQEENARLKEEIEMIKQTLASEVSHMFDSLVEEKIRYDRLEEQVNDLTELHQNEMENLKQAVKDLENMEEKVQYKNEENIKDLNEMVESCQTKIFRMEHQQAQQQQQFLTLEGLENSNARMLFVKLINILLTVLQVLLLIIATVAGILTPLLQTKTRLITTATICLFVLFIYLQLSEIKDTWTTCVSRVTEFLS